MREFLIKKRTDLNIKQYELAEHLQCSKRQLRRYENGECEIPLDLAIKWAKKFKLSMNQFVKLYK